MVQAYGGRAAMGNTELSERAEHIEWVFREACVKSHTENRKEKRPVKGQWFQLACLIEELFPAETKAYYEKNGIDPQ